MKILLRYISICLAMTLVGCNLNYIYVLFNLPMPLCENSSLLNWLRKVS